MNKMLTFALVMVVVGCTQDYELSVKDAVVIGVYTDGTDLKDSTVRKCLGDIGRLKRNESSEWGNDHFMLIVWVKPDGDLDRFIRNLERVNGVTEVKIH